MNRTALVLVLLLAAAPAFGTVPPVRTPPHADTVTTATPAAPLLVPGRPQPADSLRMTPNQAARGQYALGRQLERAGHLAPAIVAYRNAVQLDPRVLDAHYRMGRLFSAASQPRVAAAEYEAELANDSGRVDAQRWLGLALAQSGDTARAVARLEALVRADARDEPSWQALGFAYGVGRRPAQAENALRRALALDAKDADAWRDLGTVLSSLQRDAEARDAFHRAAALDPRDPGVWVNLGNLEYRDKRWAPALQDFRKAIALDSSQVLAWRGQLAVCAAQRRPEDAGDVYRAWLAKVPEQPELRMEAMRWFDALGRKDVALELARDGVRVAPRSGEARLALGMALHESGSARAALGELRHAEALMRKPEQRARVGALIRAMRSHAPDSLRAFFAADSARFERAAAAPDSAAGRK